MTVTPPLVRFHRLVDRRGDDECWPWLGTRHNFGYGRFALNMEVRGRWVRTVGAHRASLIFLVGPPPADNSEALHRCDNPPCVNPAHLYWGTQADNVHDMLRRGRASGGTVRRDECRRGHPFPPRRPGAPGRECPICAAAREKRKQAVRQRKRAASKPTCCPVEYEGDAP